MDDAPMWSLKKLKAYIIHVKSRFAFVVRAISAQTGKPPYLSDMQQLIHF